MFYKLEGVHNGMNGLKLNLKLAIESRFEKNIMKNMIYE